MIPILHAEGFRFQRSDMIQLEGDTRRRGPLKRMWVGTMQYQGISVN